VFKKITKLKKEKVIKTGVRMTSRVSVLKIFTSMLVFLFLMGLVPAVMSAPASDAVESQSEVIGAFTGIDEVAQDVQDAENEFRHKLLFAMGATLLIFVFATAYFGLAMGLFGKQVFVPHMICAGITVFLAMAHSVVAVVWFFPF